MPASTRRLTLHAPAKINLYLAVGETRDDGYHDVETVLQTISLADTVTLEPADALSVLCEPDLGVPAEENLAYRAALALAEALGRTPGVRITLAKRIPAGGGLGGASSDAAAVLYGLARMWEVGLDPGGASSTPLLRDLAASLGADVPFFLEGGTALYTERGDVLRRRVETPDLHLALAKPYEPVPTGAAYAAFDRLPSLPAPGAQSVIRACESGDPADIAGMLYNNMTGAATALVPSVGEVMHACRAAEGVLGVALAGSGSTVFSVCESHDAASGLVDSCVRRGWWSRVARTVGDGVRTVEAEVEP